ncbi:MAG TPA: hypothetical protein VF376_12665 [Thermoanaerobaculia bacterium]
MSAEKGDPGGGVCRLLRWKAGWLPDRLDPNPDPLRSTSIQQFWCLKTMRSDGPDGDLAVTEYCREGRSCFESPDPDRRLSS